MASVFQILILMLIGNGIVYTAILMTSGGFMPETFAPFYEKTTAFFRLILTSATLIVLANYVFSKTFTWFDPILVAPINIVAFVLVQVAIAVLISKSVPSLMIIPAVAGLCACTYWVYTIINPAVSS